MHSIFDLLMLSGLRTGLPGPYLHGLNGLLHFLDLSKASVDQILDLAAFVLFLLLFLKEVGLIGVEARVLTR
jgi:hypothetical protein